jgi:3',5'-cyclic-AMP phosphodiesterase
VSDGVRIVQLTDLHLTERVGARVFGSDVWGNLDRVLAALPQVGVIDRVVMTGDIANSGSAIAYERLRERLAPYRDRLWLLPGNHDDRDCLRAAFPEQWQPGPKLSLIADLGGVRHLGLDSKQPGRTRGRVGDEQLGWLRARIPACGPWVLWLHHPPLKVGCWWLDKDLLRDRRELATVLSARPPLAIFTGHVHQEFRGVFAGSPVTTTPAVAYQYMPRSWAPLPSSLGPAFRLLEFAGNSFASRSVRL